MSRKNKSHKRKCDCCGFRGVKLDFKNKIAENEIIIFIKNIDYKFRLGKWKD